MPVRQRQQALVFALQPFLNVTPLGADAAEYAIAGNVVALAAGRNEELAADLVIEHQKGRHHADRREVVNGGCPVAGVDAPVFSATKRRYVPARRRRRFAGALSH